MKKSEMLQEARGRVERRIKSSVQGALIGCVRLCPAAIPQYIQLITWIQGMMGGEYTYEFWLKKHHQDFVKEHGLEKASCGDFTCLEGRLAWLDWMIAYWKEQEAKE